MAQEHVDVLIVGAGLSGVGAACHLTQNCPGKTFAILEARDAIGGTWDLFRYPGIRSDSDMFTLGYSFRPWNEGKAIADGPAIRNYVCATASDHGVEDRIRFNHRVVHADWSSEEARWTVDAERTDTGETVTLTCSFLFGCTGYYRYDEGYLPHFEGRERFPGPIVHPQHWPEELDYDGKRVVVIGSGATAVTLVPAMADRAAHVTMLQRSPSYVVTLPAEDPIARLLQRALPPKAAYALVRWKNVLLMMGTFNMSRWKPDFVSQSFYKMFGYPTGVGCLVARKSALAILQRPWFGGGTITVASVQGDKFYLAEGASAFEDGTPNYLALPAIEFGLRYLSDVGIDTIHTRVGCLAGWLIARLSSLRHSGGAPLARIYGPRSDERRGGTITFNLYDRAGRAIDHLDVEGRANAFRISLRTGCFCNPGGGEIALGITGTELSSCFRQPEHETRLTIDDFRLCIDGKSTGAVRVSLGLASNVADIDAFIAFAETFLK